MPADTSPKVLHFNDCANVGLFLVQAAAAQGYQWDFLPPEQVRPQRTPRPGIDRLRWVPYAMKRYRHLSKTQLVHVHYATSVPLIKQQFMPSRPYFLHLHGSDIRRRWLEPQYHKQVQSAIDNACAVFFTNMDTVEQARKARPDAIYMPAFVQPKLLPSWNLPLRGASKRIVFTSRWDQDKGVDKQLDLATRLVAAFPNVSFEGLDWGPGAAAAAAAGVHLHKPMSHKDFLSWLAGADMAIGQANVILAISEFEAMAIGLPLAALGKRIPREDDNTTPPVIEGSVEQVLEGVRETLNDPQSMAKHLGSKEWVLSHHTPDPWIQPLLEFYRAAL